MNSIKPIVDKEYIFKQKYKRLFCSVCKTHKKVKLRGDVYLCDKCHTDRIEKTFKGKVISI